MFIPYRLERVLKIPFIVKGRRLRAGIGLVLFVVSLSTSVGFARILENYSKKSLYAVTTDKATFISLTGMNNKKMDALIQTALDHPKVKSRLKGMENSYRLLNYILPANLYVSEIPMNKVDGMQMEHYLPRNLKTVNYKIIFTGAIESEKCVANHSRVLDCTIALRPLIEVWIDMDSLSVLRTLEPPSSDNYKGIPMPLF